MQLSAIRRISISLFCIFTLNSSAQNLTQSPYSFIGIGELQFMGSNLFSSIGQATQGIRRLYDINTSNPASYSSLKQTNIEAGGMLMNGTFTSNNKSSLVSLAGLNYFNFGSNVSEKYGLGIVVGVAPFSSIGYDVSSTTSVQADTFSMPAMNIFTGEGGLNRAFVGSGIKLAKSISIGINAGYVFGQINSSNTFLYPKEFKRFNVAEDQRNYIGGFLVEYGIQLHLDSIKNLIPSYKSYKDTLIKIHPLSGKIDTIYKKKFSQIKNENNYFLRAGLTFNLQSNLDISQQYTLRTLPIGFPTGVKDTVSHSDNFKGEILLPFGAKYGISLGNSNKWMIAADAGTTMWQDYKMMGKSDLLRNSFTLNLGATYLPNPRDDERNYFKRIEYRTGFRYEKTNIFINETGIDLMGISFGISIPVAGDDRYDFRYKKYSRINLGFEYLTRGNENPRLVKEEYFRFTLGVVFTDRWFLRFKYD